MKTCDMTTRQIILAATGGTIATPRHTHRPLNAGDLAHHLRQALPDPSLGIMPIDLDQVASSNLTPNQVLAWIRQAHTWIQEGYDGIVLTHGTDTLEETAFLFDLFWDQDAPIVITGAMRSAKSAGEDGPRNLIAAYQTALDPRSRGKGPLVVMNEQIFAGCEVTKQHSWQVSAFGSENGALGAVGPFNPLTYDRPYFRSHPLPLPASLSGTIPILTPGLGDNGQWIRNWPSKDLQGLVVAAGGLAGIPPGFHLSIKEKARNGIPVVICTRCPAGGTRSGVDGDGLLWAGHLNPVKARLALLVGMQLFGPNSSKLLAVLRRNDERNQCGPSSRD